MRRANRAFLFAGLLVLGCAAVGLGEPSAEEQPDARVKAILREYERAAKSTREIHYRYTQTTEDLTFQTRETVTGQVFYRKPDLVRIDWKAEKGDCYHYLFAERQFHIFEGPSKTEIIYPVPKEFGFPDRPGEYPKDKGFLLKVGGWFLEKLAILFLQLPIRDLEQNCDVRLKSEDREKIVLEFEPRTERFQGDFVRMEVVLSPKTYRVRRVWFEQSNDSTTCVEVENAVINPEKGITAESIREGLPQGWERLEAGREKE